MKSVVDLVACAGALLAWGVITAVFTHESADFAQDYFAAFSLRQGLPIYGPHIVDLTLEHTTLPESSMLECPELLANYHPPLNSLLFLPFTWLSYERAFVLWSVVSLLMYLASLAILTTELGFESRARVRLAVAFCYWYPFLFGIAMGQIAILVFFLTTLAWSLQRRGNLVPAGLALGFGVLIKLTPGFLLVFFAFRRQWRAIGAAVVTVALGMGLTILAIGPEDVARYHMEIVPENLEKYGSEYMNVSIPASPLAFLHTQMAATCWPAGGPPVEAVRRLAMAAGGLFALLATALAYPLVARRGQFDRAFGLLVTTLLLVTPTVWSHTFVFLILPLLVLWRARAQGEVGAPAAIAGVASFVGLTVPDVIIRQLLLPDYPGDHLPLGPYLLLELNTLAALLLWLVFAGVPRRWFAWSSGAAR